MAVACDGSRRSIADAFVARPFAVQPPARTEQDARDVLAALARSGKPVSAFAAEHGLDPQRVYLWRRRLGGAERTTFQELMVRPAVRRTATDEGTGFEIVLRTGDMVRVPPCFEGAALVPRIYGMEG
jgi:hypothetical protein